MIHVLNCVFTAAQLSDVIFFSEKEDWVSLSGKEKENTKKLTTLAVLQWAVFRRYLN